MSERMSKRIESLSKYTNEQTVKSTIEQLLPWMPEVFLACGGKQKPENALEKPLAPRVNN